MMKKYLMTGLAAMTMTALAGPAAAQDEALYAKEPPASAGFVRFINATGDAQGEIRIGKKSVEFDEDLTTDYLVLEGDMYDWSIGDVTGSQNVEAKKFYTLALVDGEDGPEVTVFDDEADADPKKCAIYVYNFSDADDVDLHAASVGKNGADIVADVAPMKSGSRAVNALTVDLELRKDGEVLAEYPQTTFQRKTGISYLVLPGSGEESAIVVKNTIERLD